jgi:tetrahydromethanopterin S-methyltransferase subunit G
MGVAFMMLLIASSVPNAVEVLSEMAKLKQRIESLEDRVAAFDTLIVQEAGASRYYDLLDEE